MICRRTRQYHNRKWRISLLQLSPYMCEFSVGSVGKVLPQMICPQLVNITMESDILPHCNCHHICVWILYRLGGESTPLDDMSSTRQYHNGKWHISSLYFCHYICVWILGGLGVAAHCCSLLLCATLYCSLVFAAWLQPAMEQGTHPVTTPGTRQQITKNHR